MPDVNVLIAGLVWPRWQFEILKHAIQGDFTVVLAPLIITSTYLHVSRIDSTKLSDLMRFVVKTRPEMIPNPTKAEIQQYPDLVRDEADVPIALAAINAKVDYFITYDKDFTEEHESTEKVRQALPGIILPPVFLRDVMGWDSEALEAIRDWNWHTT